MPIHSEILQDKSCLWSKDNKARFTLADLVVCRVNRGFVLWHSTPNPTIFPREPSAKSLKVYPLLGKLWLIASTASTLGVKVACVEFSWCASRSFDAVTGGANALPGVSLLPSSRDCAGSQVRCGRMNWPIWQSDATCMGVAQGYQELMDCSIILYLDS